MYSLSISLFLPMINALVAVEIHRYSYYHPLSSCAFISNASLSNDASIQTCIWECVHEHECQTAVFFNNEKICSMFAEFCKTGSIQSSGDVRASVVCSRKNHEPIITCSSSATSSQEDEETTISDLMTSTAQRSAISSTTLTSTTTTTTTLTSTTTIATANPYSCGNMTTWLNTDLSCCDLSVSTSTNWTACCTLCLSTAACGSFTFVINAHNCYLKTTAPNNGSFNAGSVFGRYP